MRTFIVVADDGGALQLAQQMADDGQEACTKIALLDNLAPGVGLVAYDTNKQVDCIMFTMMLLGRLTEGPIRLEPIR